MNKECVLIDGSGFIYRAYHALPPLTRSDGTPIGAVYGFTSMLISILEESSDSQFISVILDASRINFRTDIYPEYKANRSDVPKDLIPQFAIVRSACEAFNIPSIEQNGFEADDLIASYATKASQEGFLIKIIGSDKDLLQLINEKISVYDPIKRKVITEKDILEKYGVKINQLIDFQALVGDSIDNIPGVEGVGQKTAAKLLQTYNTLEDIFSNTSELPKGKLKERLENQQKEAYLSKKLVTLRKDLNLQLNDLKRTALNSAKLINFLNEQEFKTFIPRISKLFAEDAEMESVLLTFSDELENFLKNSYKSGKLAIHLHKETCTICINGLIRHFELSEEKNIILKNYLKEPGILKIGLDIKALFKKFNDIQSYDDIKILAYLLGKSLTDYSENNINEFIVICDSLKEDLRKNKLTELYELIEKPLIPILAEIENVGIKINPDVLKNISVNFSDLIEKIEKTIFELVGKEFLIGSPKQLAEVLFSNGTNKKRGKSGTLSTDHEVLESLAAQGDLLSAYVLEWRHLSKLKSTYSDALLEQINKKTNRIHTTFKMTTTTTGRLASVDPNLQNIPIKTEEGRLIRSAFIPDEGYKFVSLDYSQIELRILAHMANVELLKKAFHENVDIHAMTAAKVFNVTEVDESWRRKAKVINFGIIYGMSSYGLSKQLKIPQQQAAQYINSYFNRYPEIKKYMEKTKAFAKENGYVLTLFNRRCFIRSPNKNFAERQAINAPIQGTAADIMKKATINVANEIKKLKLNSKIVLQVHDELLFEVPEIEVDYSIPIFKKAMEEVVSLNVPLIVEVKKGKNWAEMMNGAIS